MKLNPDKEYQIKDLVEMNIFPGKTPTYDNYLKYINNLVTLGKLERPRIENGGRQTRYFKGSDLIKYLKK